MTRVVHILAVTMGLSANDIKSVVERYHDHLGRYRDALNGLNVYPVPDGDTGTNMALTIGSVRSAIEAAQTMDEVAAGIAHGSLMGARGNSGVILSQILRGLCDCFRAAGEVDTEAMSKALIEAARAAYKAVSRPIEGTILTVIRQASETHPEGELEVYLGRAHEEAVSALRSTPDLLPVLKQAGVVDAGGVGFLLLLSSFLEIASGSSAPIPLDLLEAKADLAALDGGDEIADLRYEVMFFLETDDEAVDRFRGRWETVGDSIVVVGGDGVWNCHIHTDDIGASIEAGIAVGRPYDIRVTDLTEQAGAHATGYGFDPTEDAARAVIGVVAVATGSGIIEIFRQLGVQGMVVGGQTMNPSTDDLLAVVDAVPADTVVVLPNNKNIVPVAEQLNALSTKQVVVVPTRSVQQGIAAMFGYDPGTTNLGGTVDDMAAAASSVVDGEVTRAVRDAVIDFGPIKQGEWIGIADGSILVADADLEAALRGLVAAILPPGAELLTLYVGEGSTMSTTKALTAWLAELYPRLEVNVVDGGQPLYPYLVSVE